MNSQHNNNQLDTFFSNALKNLDIKQHQADWSEMEPSLGQMRKPINVNINFKPDKKIIFIGGIVLIVGLLIIVLLQTLDFNNTESESENISATDTVQNILNADTLMTTTSPAIISADTLHKDSIAPDSENKKADTAKVVSVEEKAEVKITEEKKTKEELKEKTTISADSTAKNTSPADSSKKMTSPKNSKKDNKQKDISSDSSATASPIPVKTDSLKQQ